MQMVLFRKAVIGLVCVALFVSGCASTGENTTGRTMGTAVGALGGALLGHKQGGKGGALLGALLGGAAGYAVGWLVDDYTAKKTKSAQEVRDQYAQARPQQAQDHEQKSVQEEKQDMTGQDPQQTQLEPEIHAFAVTVNPDETLVRGKGGEIVSSFDLVAEEGTKVQVEEERSIVSPDGKELKKKRYVYKEVDGGGRYEFSTKVPPAKDIEQGRYSIASKLYIDGKEAGSADSGFQFVSRGNARRIARR